MKKKGRKGSLLNPNDFSPPLIPPRTIPDPRDKKPEDWVDNEFMDDPFATKPDDWDENAPEFIPDPKHLDPPEGWLLNEIPFLPDPRSQKPKQWDEKKQGKWQARKMPNPKCLVVPGCGKYTPPKIRNPNYKGKWKPPKIPNPEFIGEWTPAMIENPYYFEEKDPFHHIQPIGGIGFELWTIHSDVGFNNILIGNDESTIRKWNREVFVAKRDIQVERSFTDIDNIPIRKKKMEGKGFWEALKIAWFNIKLSISDVWDQSHLMVILMAILFFSFPAYIITAFCNTCGCVHSKFNIIKNIKKINNNNNINDKDLKTPKKQNKKIKRKLTPQEIEQRKQLKIKKKIKTESNHVNKSHYPGVVKRNLQESP